MDKKYILFIAGDPVDIILAQMVFRDSEVENELSIVSSFDQALKFVRKEMPYEHEHAPDLIVVDFNTSDLKGWVFLREVKADPVLKRIPVIVINLLMLEHDISRLYDLNVNCCIRKPVDIEEYTKVIEKIDRFWLNTVRFDHSRSRISAQTRSEAVS